MRTALTLLLAACGGAAPDVEPAPTPEPPVAPAPSAIEPAPAAAVPLAVEPVSITWDAARSSIAVEAKLVGAALATRAEPIYVGVTVVTTEGKEVDLLVSTLFPGSLEQPLLFSTELPNTPRHVLIGAWNTKVEPCAVDRPGCKEFGFVLDDSLASFPARLYTEGMRQRFLPSTYAIGVVGDVSAVRQAAGRFASVFGASVELSPATSDRSTGVWVAEADDLGFAYAVAEALGGAGAPIPYGRVEGQSPPMVVVLPH
jgi:hypothetical protein